MTNRIAVAALALVVTACAMARHREQVRNGMLTVGLHRVAFLEEWGPPAQTYATPSTGVRLKFAPFAGTLQPPMFEVWAYPSRQTCLTFDGARLQSWKRGVTDCEPKPEGTKETRVEPN